MCCRELLWTLSDAELNLLEKSLCSTDDTDRSSAMLAELSGLPPELLLSVDVQPLSEFYADDLSDTDDAAASRGLMVHSESTMTVVARPVTAEADDAAATSSSSSVVTDAEARRLHHSKSWPQSADGNRAAASTSFDGVTTSSVTVYGNQQFNFNLPHNTSTEHLYGDTHAAAAAANERFVDQSIIYLSSPTSSITEEPQIAYITDELCRIFCTDTASLEEDDDNDELGVESSDLRTVESLASNDVETSASMQQQCLQVIACDCESSVENMTASADETLSLVDSMTSWQAVSVDITDPMPFSRSEIRDIGCTETETSCLDSPSSTDQSSPTVIFADNISPSTPTLSELSADVVLAASSDVEPVLLSPPVLPSMEMQDTSADSVAAVCCDHSSSDVMTSNESNEIATEDVAVTTLEESFSDVDELSVVDSDVKSTPSSSTHHSLHPCHTKQSSPPPVIDTEAVKTDCAKCHTWSQSWNCAAAAGELGRDHERCVSVSSH